MQTDTQISALCVARWPVGGIRTYLREMFRQKHFAGVRFTVLMPETVESKHLADEISSERIKWLFTENSAVALAQAAWRLIRSGDFALVHSHGFTSAMCTSLPVALQGLPHLVTAHDVFTKGQFSGFRGEIKRLGVQALLRRADVLHAVTEDGRNNILEFLPTMKARASRIDVIPHGVDTNKLVAATARDLRSELKLPPATFLFGFFGRFMAQKGFRVLVSAVRIIREQGLIPQGFRVICVGAGGYIQEDRDLIQQQGLSELFVFLPFEREIGSSLKAVDAVVMPSLWEASGLLAMEALVCGTPLIASSCIGLRETVANTPVRTVVPKDAAELARAMIEEATAPSRAQALQFVPTAVQRFNASTSFEALRVVYDQLLGACP